MGPEQLAEVVDRYASALVLYARQWCASPEDVVQTAFMKLVRLNTPPDKLLPWLYRVVRNGAIDASRAARRRHHYEAAAADSAPKWFAPSYDPTGLDAQSAAAALADLPAETREIIVAHIWGGLTFEQIARGRRQFRRDLLSAVCRGIGNPSPETRSRTLRARKMNTPSTNPSNAPDPLAVALSKLDPAPHGFDYNALMFAAGRESKARVTLLAHRRGCVRSSRHLVRLCPSRAIKELTTETQRHREDGEDREDRRECLSFFLLLIFSVFSVPLCLCG